MIPVMIFQEADGEGVWGYVPAEIIEVQGDLYLCQEVESDRQWVIPAEVVRGGG